PLAAARRARPDSGFDPMRENRKPHGSYGTPTRPLRRPPLRGRSGAGGPVARRTERVTSVDVVFVLLAGIAFTGFVLDALFDRIRISSILPLMLVGILLVQVGLVPAHDLAVLNAFIPYVSGLTIAFILFAVGLEIRFGALARVLGRASLFTLSLQTATGIVLAVVVFETFHWNFLLALVLGFGLSGPSTVAVPALLRVVRLGEGLRTTLLFEAVASDVLQLLVPLLLIGIYQSGRLSIPSLGETLLLSVVGSAVAGIVAGVLWLWILDRLRAFAAGYTWTLTITIVLATYGLADLIGFTPAITIFVFGLMLGNSMLLDADRTAVVTWRTSALRRFLYDLRQRFRLSTGGLDIEHIQQVHKEVSFFASSFFFVYLGLLFQTAGLTPLVIAIPIALAVIMLAMRVAFLPLLRGYFSRDPEAGRRERTIAAFNISRGLSAAVVATLPLGLGIVVPHFLDLM
ncbi:sodium/hydrogen exchanger, partial [mine drainage metagenome]